MKLIAEIVELNKMLAKLNLRDMLVWFVYLHNMNTDHLIQWLNK